MAVIDYSTFALQNNDELKALADAVRSITDESKSMSITEMAPLVEESSVTYFGNDTDLNNIISASITSDNCSLQSISDLQTLSSYIRRKANVENKISVAQMVYILENCGSILQYNFRAVAACCDDQSGGSYNIEFGTEETGEPIGSVTIPFQSGTYDTDFGITVVITKAETKYYYTSGYSISLPQDILEGYFEINTAKVKNLHNIKFNNTSSDMNTTLEFPSGLKQADRRSEFVSAPFTIFTSTDIAEYGLFNEHLLYVTGSNIGNGTALEVNIDDFISTEELDPVNHISVSDVQCKYLGESGSDYIVAIYGTLSAPVNFGSFILGMRSGDESYYYSSSSRDVEARATQLVIEDISLPDINEGIELYAYTLSGISKEVGIDKVSYTYDIYFDGAVVGGGAVIYNDNYYSIAGSAEYNYEVKIKLSSKEGYFNNTSEWCTYTEVSGSITIPKDQLSHYSIGNLYINGINIPVNIVK